MGRQVYKLVTSQCIIFKLNNMTTMNNIFIIKIYFYYSILKLLKLPLKLLGLQFKKKNKYYMYLYYDCQN